MTCKSRTFISSKERQEQLGLTNFVFANADEPEKLERLCRYVIRLTISEQRVSMTGHGKVRYELKTNTP